MRRRVRLGLVLAIAVVAALHLRAARAADGGVAMPCTLPSGLAAPCAINSDCSLYGNAVCNVAKMLCQCNGTVDMATSVAHDGGTGGTGGSGGGTGGSGGTPSTGGGGSSTSIFGGGMTEPPKSGCSYTPGQR